MLPRCCCRRPGRCRKYHSETRWPRVAVSSVHRSHWYVHSPHAQAPAAEAPAASAQSTFNIKLLPFDEKSKLKLIKKVKDLFPGINVVEVRVDVA